MFGESAFGELAFGERPSEDTPSPAVINDASLPMPRWRVPVGFVTATAICLLMVAPATARATNWTTSQIVTQRPVAPAPGFTQSALTLSAQGPAPFVPSLWPAPARPTTFRAQQTIIRSSGDVAQTTAAPFTQTNWPVPRLVKPAPLTWTAPTPLPLTVAPAAKPFLQSNWPIVRLQARLRIEPTPNLLHHALAVPLRQNEWPLATRARVAPQTWTQERDQFLVDLRPKNQIDWPLPRAAGRLRIAPTPNLLKTTLGTTAATPTVPVLWPVPRRPITWRPSQTISRGADGVAPPAVVPFFGQPFNLPPPRPFPVALRTWTDGRKPFHVDLTPAHQTDWPNPTGKPNGIISNRFFTFYYVVDDSTPFTQSDWPTPQAKPSLSSLRFVSDSRKPFHVDLTPANQTQWPLPVVRTPRAFIDQPVNTQALLASLLPPFVQTDWPLAVRARVAPLSWIQERDQFLIDLTPAHLTDWPLAIRARVAPHTWTQDRDQFLVDLTPKNLYDWPNPRTKVAHVGLRTHTDNVLTSTLGETPFKLTDWPVPQGKSSLSTLRFASDSRKAFHVDLTPASLTEWPVPTGREFNRQLRTHVDHVLTSTISLIPPVKPYLNSDWPLPASKPAIATLRFATDARKPYHVDLTPANQFQWPLPVLTSPPLVEGSRGFQPGQLDAPHRQVDWPLPRAQASRVVDGTRGFSPGSLDEPFRADQWPRPTAPPDSLRFDQPPNLLTRTVASPFALAEWPLPAGASVAPPTWTQNAIVTTLTPIPAAQRDWSVPSRPRPPIVAWTASPSNVLAIAAPVAQYWPLPRLKPSRPISDCQSSATWLLTTPAPAPSQSHWPLPRVANGTAITWLGSNAVPLNAAPQPDPDTVTTAAAYFRREVTAGAATDETIIITANAYFWRVATVTDASIRRTVTPEAATIRRMATSRDGER